MSERYTVLSPWAATDNREKLPINPRLDTLGGGDHGGPICKKAVLPRDWDALCQEYPGTMPQYVDY